MVYGRWKDQDGHFINTSMVYTNEGTIFNPTEEDLIRNGFTKYVPPVYEPTAEEILENARNEMLHRVEDYDKSPEVNSFLIGGQSMWLDFDERSRIKTSLDAYKASGATQMSKWFDGHEFTFTIEQWEQMLVALEIYASEALNVTEAHKAAINALSTAEEIEAYDYTTGYPTKLNF